MEVTKTYNVSMQRMFDVLRNSFLEDYLTNTRQTLAPDQIVEGLSYIKSFGKHNQVQVVVKQIESPYIYDVEIRSNRGINRMTYRLKELAEWQTEVTYSESIELGDIIGKLNYKLLYPFMRKRMEQRMALQLDTIANHAVERGVPRNL